MAHAPDTAAGIALPDVLSTTDIPEDTEVVDVVVDVVVDMVATRTPRTTCTPT